MLMTLRFPAPVQGYAYLVPSKPNEHPAILMKDMAGGTLASAIQKKQVTATAMNEVIISMVRGLFHLHSQSVIHCDLKPSNVLFTSEGLAKIGDFGSAHGIGNESVSLSKGGKTQLYSAPELNEEGGEPSELSDVCALLLTICEVTIFEAGAPAFNPRWAITKLIRTVNSEQRPGVPVIARAELVEVIKSCWDKDPTKRMTAGQIVTKLSGVGWMLLKGADPKAVKGFLKRFPFDASTSLNELIAALEQRDHQGGALTAEVSSLTPRLQIQREEKSTLKSRLESQQRANSTLESRPEVGSVYRRSCSSKCETSASARRRQDPASSIVADCASWPTW
jgi:serine/threonine protein kinase